MVLQLPEFKTFQLFKTSRDLDVGIGQSSRYKTVTKTLTLPAHVFQSEFNSDDVLRTSNRIEPNAGSVFFYAPIIIPDGAVLVAAVVYGSGAEKWIMKRQDFSGGAGNVMVMGTNLNTEATSISYSVIDNKNYNYVFITEALDKADTDRIFGAKITYEVDEII